MADAPTRERAGVGLEGVQLAPGSDAVLDVLFDGRRIWSVDRTMKSIEAEGLVPWPESLRPYLDGSATVALRDHQSGDVLLERALSFGSGDGVIAVVDEAGRPLALSKWGELVEPFDSASGGSIDATLEQTAEVLRALSEECGLPSFITYGTLLGAVRDGKLIGHDDDVDVAYLSSHEHPADVSRESFELQRFFARKGWEVKRFSNGFLQVVFPGSDGRRRHVDVFTCFHVLDRFYEAFAVGADLPRSAIVPIGQVTLHGRQLPAPADPEALLEATYGPKWRVPDPSFQFKIRRETRRRIGGWLGGLHVNIKYWDEFYRSQRSADVPREPSAFARWVSERERGTTPVVDVGSGTGRDSLWFAREGHPVLGLDYSEAAIERATSAAAGDGLDNTRFEVLDLYDLRQVMAMGTRLAHEEEDHVLYGRFLVHALEDAGRHNLWRLAEMALNPGGLLYLEFRTGEDENQPHEFGEHFRRYLSPDQVVAEIEERGGTIEHREASHGLAVYRDEDPHVCRVVAGWA